MTALSVANLSGHFCYDFPERCCPFARQHFLYLYYTTAPPRLQRRGCFFFSQGHPPPAKSFTDAKQNRCFCRLKNRETSVILVFESAVYITAGGLHLSGLTSGRRTFLLCPRRSTAKGGMLHDAFGNFSSAHVACNCELRRFQYRLENL